MQYMLDTANPQAVASCLDKYPVTGVTTNPTILRAAGEAPLKTRLLELRKLCGPERSLHVQLVARDAREMLLEADALLALLGNNTFVKVPVTEQGCKAIRLLKQRSIPVTATAVYGLPQALLAVEAGADYIAPYCNRMENLGLDFRPVLETLRRLIDRDHYAARIVAASFKNARQVTDAFASGAHAVTVSPELLTAPLGAPMVQDAVAAFEDDFAKQYACRSLIEALR